MKRVLILAVILPLLVSGCATERGVEVKVNRVEVESPKSTGITEKFAVSLFRDVANQCGLIVEGPIPVQIFNTESEYIADPPGKIFANRVSLLMWVDKQSIRFESAVYGTAKDFPRAKQTASLFQQALDKQGIPYKTRVSVASPLLGP